MNREYKQAYIKAACARFASLLKSGVYSYISHTRAAERTGMSPTAVKHIGDNSYMRAQLVEQGVLLVDGGFFVIP